MMRTCVHGASMRHVHDVFAGRLVGLLIGEAMVVERVRLLVLDEADKLAEEGFEPQLNHVARRAIMQPH